jgi:phospholipid:diacylglycerol acyltransferase
MIENLADVGYDGSKMSMMSYDWRLGYDMMERRDGFFTKLKMQVEGHYITTGEKVVLVSHSMGGTVVNYFLQWVTADLKYGGGGGGKNWVDKHIHAYVNIAGTLLGVPKAIPALLSGEMKDTAAVFVQFAGLLEQYFGRRWRKNLWNTWGSLFGMLPKGGDAIWGIGSDVVVGEDNFNEKNSTQFHNASELRNKYERFPIITWADDSTQNCTVAPFNETGWTMHDTLDYIYNYGGGYSDLIYSSVFSHESKKGWKKRTASLDKRKHWHDPIAMPLPRAPSMKLYCLYGVGVPTERSYHYKLDCGKVISNQSTCSLGVHDNSDDRQCINSTDLDEPPEWPAGIDTSAYDEQKDLQYGVRFSDGDGTVPLISLGYMCQKWAQPHNQHNPSGIRVYTRERKHTAEVLITDPGRGGPLSGEHVDILGNIGVIEDVVRIATDFEVNERVDKEIIHSELKRITKAIDSHPEGGLEHAYH